MSNNFDFNSVWSEMFRFEEIEERLTKSVVDIVTLTKMMYDEFYKAGFDENQATAMTIEWIKAANIAAAMTQRGNQ